MRANSKRRTCFYDSVHIVDNVLWSLRLSVLDCYCNTLPADVLHRGVDEMGFGHGMSFDVDAFSNMIFPLELGAVPGGWAEETHCVVDVCLV